MCDVFEKLFDQKNQTEEFLNEIVLHLSDYVIFVVNNLTRPDQQLLNQQVKKRDEIKNKKYKGIWLFHNYKDVKNEAEKNTLWEKVVKIYPGSEKRDDVTVNGVKQIGKYYLTEQGNVEIRHVLLVNDECPEGLKSNPIVFEMIRKWCSSIVNKVDGVVNANTLEPLVEAVKLILPRKLTTISAEMIKFDNDRGFYLIEAPLNHQMQKENKQSTVKFDYSIAEVNKQYIIELETPGLIAESFVFQSAANRKVDFFSISVKCDKKKNC